MYEQAGLLLYWLQFYMEVLGENQWTISTTVGRREFM